MKLTLYKIDVYRGHSKLFVFWFESKNACHSIYSENGTNDARRMFDALPALRKKVRIEKQDHLSTIHLK